MMHWQSQWHTDSFIAEIIQHDTSLAKTIATRPALSQLDLGRAGVDFFEDICFEIPAKTLTITLVRDARSVQSLSIKSDLVKL